ncbi:MAG: 5-(carboxyamino)imidazole ribonucleotide synthase [Pseudanabaenaceae cyanobacterium]
MTRPNTATTSPQHRHIGIIGGGQLAWMMAQAAQSLPIDVIVQAAHPTEPAATVSPQVVYGAVQDAQATAQLAQITDVITFENEFVDLVALNRLAVEGTIFYPSLGTLALTVDKLSQRQHFDDHGIPTPRFWAVDHWEQVLQVMATQQFPLVLKTRRHGYDGNGTWVIRDLENLEKIWQQLVKVPDANSQITQGDALEANAILEAFIPFERELAIIAARNQQGEIALYPVTETVQVNQVCRRTITPAPVNSAIQTQVRTIATQLLESLAFVGVLGIEFFLTPSGQVLVNEIAPRTHNSGHYTIEGCDTSQFSQLLRIVAGLPMGDTTMQAPVAAMVNLLGTIDGDTDYFAQRQAIAALNLSDQSSQLGIYIHWYGKNQSRRGRKLGHVTILADNHATAAAAITAVERIWYGD